MQRIEIGPPIKTPDRYEFPYDLVSNAAGRRSWVWGVWSSITGSALPPKKRRTFGFRAVNFPIQHCPLWDSIFPLMFFTRKGGHLFRGDTNKGILRFRYPVLEKACDFYVRRAKLCGLEITVEADTYDRSFDLATRGHQISFGGGKESRLILGLLQELGECPRVHTAGRSKRPDDIPDVLSTEASSGTFAEWLMPSLMSGSAHVYVGGALAEASYTQPWHQYYDVSSPQGHHETSALLQSLGAPITLHSPVCVLPSNLTQRILAQRFPDLFAHQRSVEVNQDSEKNLHVSLLKLYHDMAFSDHCSDELFRRLLHKFVETKLRKSGQFGFHNARKVFHQEMMAIIFRCRTHPLLSGVQARIPSTWDGTWIDQVHSYVHPRLDRCFRQVFSEYASEYRPRPGCYVVPTPPGHPAISWAA